MQNYSLMLTENMQTKTCDRCPKVKNRIKVKDLASWTDRWWSCICFDINRNNLDNTRNLKKKRGTIRMEINKNSIICN